MKQIPTTNFHHSITFEGNEIRHEPPHIRTNCGIIKGWEESLFGAGINSDDLTHTTGLVTSTVDLASVAHAVDAHDVNLVGVLSSNGESGSPVSGSWRIM